MILIFLLLVAVQVFSAWTFSAGTTEADTRSKDLFDAINVARAGKGLAALPYSAALTYTAQLRVQDAQNIQDNNNNAYSAYYGGSCCPYFSWSDKGPWTGKCYPISGPSSADYLVLREKAQEMTTYPGLVYPSPMFSWSNAYSSAADCVSAFDGSSRGDKIFNRGSYSGSTWKAFGCAYTTKRCECYTSSDSTDSIAIPSSGNYAPGKLSGGICTVVSDVATDCHDASDNWICDCYPGDGTPACSLACEHSGTCCGTNLCCNCEAGWTGNQCQTSQCSAGFCKNGGVCNGPSSCDCSACTGDLCWGTQCNEVVPDSFKDKEGASTSGSNESGKAAAGVLTSVGLLGLIASIVFGCLVCCVLGFICFLYL